MTATVVALVLVGGGSVAYRLLPLLGAARVPDQVSLVAGWAGASVLAAVVVRAVLNHDDASIPWAAPVAAVSVGLGLLCAVRGRPPLVVLAVGATTYLVASATLSAWVG